MQDYNGQLKKLIRRYPFPGDKGKLREWFSSLEMLMDEAMGKLEGQQLTVERLGQICVILRDRARRAEGMVGHFNMWFTRSKWQRVRLTIANKSPGTSGRKDQGGDT